jgi:hypothetical protein
MVAASAGAAIFDISCHVVLLESTGADWLEGESGKNPQVIIKIIGKVIQPIRENYGTPSI